MSKPYLAQARLLRERIPVGLLHSLQLLTDAAGDLGQAEHQAQLFYCQQVSEKTGITTAAALEKLQRLHYDVARVLGEVALEQHTETELVLKRFATRKAEAWSYLGAVVARATPLLYEKCSHDDEWLVPALLSAVLSPPQYCLVVLADWLHYEDYEGFDYALNFWLAEVAVLIEQQLRLPVIAGYLRTARQRQMHFWADVKVKDYNPQQAQRAHDSTAKDPAFRAVEQGFDQSRPLLLEALYDYVQQRMTEFP